MNKKPTAGASIAARLTVALIRTPPLVYVATRHDLPTWLRIWCAGIVVLGVIATIIQAETNAKKAAA